MSLVFACGACFAYTECMTEFSTHNQHPVDNAETRGCPFSHEDGRLPSTNARHLGGMMISLTDPAVNKQKVTHPDIADRPEDFEPWMDPDAELAAAIEIRKAAYLADPDRICLTGDGDPAIRAASQQFLELQSDYLARHFPEIYEIGADEEGIRIIVNKASGDTYPLYPDPDHLHPLAISGLLGQEDFCLVEERDGKHYMVAGFVASPTDWDPPSFIGRDMDGVHAKFENYFKIKGAVDRILTELREYPDDIVMRNNKFLFTHGLLAYVPGAMPEQDPSTITDPGEEIFLRTERETLTRLPSTDEYPDGNRYLIFSIKAMNFSLREAAKRRGARLLRALGKDTKLSESVFAPLARDYLKTAVEQDD